MFPPCICIPWNIKEESRHFGRHQPTLRAKVKFAPVASSDALHCASRDVWWAVERPSSSVLRHVPYFKYLMDLDEGIIRMHLTRWPAALSSQHFATLPRLKTSSKHNKFKEWPEASADTR